MDEVDDMDDMDLQGRPQGLIATAASCRRSSEASADWSARKTGVLLGVLFVLTTLIRWRCNQIVTSPSIFFDEYAYVSMARSIGHWRGLLVNALGVNNPCWAHYLLLSALVAHWPMSQAFGWQQGLNSLIVAATLWPAYGLAREVGGRRRAVMAALLVVLFPMGCYSATLMAESLLLLVVTLGLWLIFRAVDKPGFVRSLGAGMVCGLAYHVKPQGLLMPAVAFLTVVLCAWARMGAPRRGFTLARTVLRQWPMGLGWLILMTPRLAEMQWIEHTEILNWRNFLGNYCGTMDGETAHVEALVPLSFLGYLASWAISAGILPVLFLVWQWPGVLRGRREPKLTTLALLASCASLVILWVSAQLSVLYPGSWYPNERYYGIFMVPTFVFFCAFAGRAAPAPASPVRRWVPLLLAPGFVAFFVWIGIAICWLVSADLPTCAGLALTFLHHHGPGLVWPILYCLVAGTGLGLILWPAHCFQRQSLGLALFLLAGDIGWYGYHLCITNPILKSDRKVARRIEKKMQGRGALLILANDLPFSTLYQAATWNPALIIYDRPDSTAPQAPWPTRPFAFAANGAFPPDLAQDAGWLLASTDWILNKPPVRQYARCALYRMDGPNSLRVKPNPFIKGQPLSDPKALAGRLKLGIAPELPLAERWRTGQRARVRFNVHNENPFITPSGELGLALTYYWTALKPSGPWRGIGQSPAHAVPIPGGIDPDQSIRLELDIQAPPDPEGEAHWRLVVHAVFARHREISLIQNERNKIAKDVELRKER